MNMGLQFTRTMRNLFFCFLMNCSFLLRINWLNYLLDVSSVFVSCVMFCGKLMLPIFIMVDTYLAIILVIDAMKTNGSFSMW